MEKLFLKYPVITYDGKQCRDLTSRVTVRALPPTSPNLYQPLDVTAGFRSDSLADAYYNDAEVDWMIYLVNRVIDPYYGWYLGENDFNAYLTDKYGDPEVAYEHIAFWRTNWYTDDKEISVQYYNHQLAPVQRRYYGPVYGQTNSIIAYRRLRQDWVVNTNMLKQYDLIGPPPHPPGPLPPPPPGIPPSAAFSNGEVVDFYSVGTKVGSGEVVMANTSSVIVQHHQGDTFANSVVTKDLVGEDSNYIATTANMVVLQQVIHDDEAIFWSPVSYFDVEHEMNERHKSVLLLNPGLVMQTAEVIRRKLAQT